MLIRTEAPADILPIDSLLKTVDCWISGLRRRHSAARQKAPKASLVIESGTQRKILKINPLIDWSDEGLMKYIDKHEVPRHPLYDQGYQSIGCFICSTPSLPGEDKRAGRWRWFNGHADVQKDGKECGLHYNI